MTKHKICLMSVARVYPHYLVKAEKKGRTKAELDAVIRWLPGCSEDEFDRALKQKINFEDFFAQAPQMNPARSLIKGMICGVRVETIEDPVMQAVRQLDKLVDELAKGKPQAKILRMAPEPAGQGHHAAVNAQTRP